MLSPKANSQQVETVRGAETIREMAESPSARIGLQRKGGCNELSNSLLESEESYGDYSDDNSN